MRFLSTKCTHSHITDPTKKLSNLSPIKFALVSFEGMFLVSYKSASISLRLSYPKYL